MAGQGLFAKRADVDYASHYGEMDEPHIINQSINSLTIVRQPGKACLLVNSLYDAHHAGEI